MDEYSAESIKIIPLSISNIRKRPGMYIGDLAYGGPNRLIHELIANVIDLYLAGRASWLQVNVEEGLVTVSDDGPGLPFQQSSPVQGCNQVEYWLTHYQNQPTADGHAPHIHLHGGGLGLVVVNALSAWLKVSSCDGQNCWTQVFTRGEVLEGVNAVPSHHAAGTKIELKLDDEIFGDAQVNLLLLRKTLFEVAHFYPGIKVGFQAERFCSRNGLLDLAFITHKHPSSFSVPPRLFHFMGQQDEVQLQVAAIGQTKQQTEFISWVNGGESIEGGSHVIALKQAFRTIGWQPELALIHVIMHSPRFAGPCRDALKCPEVIKVIVNMLAEPLSASVVNE